MTTKKFPFPNLRFQRAKTMPDIPHEYVVRTPENEAEYKELFETIGVQGVWEKFQNRRYQYWYPGDGYKYWRMTSFFPRSRIINRAQCIA